MEFGIFQAATVGERPWDESEPQRIRNDIEMGVVADEAGFDAFWAPEHHCLESYSHNSSSHLSCLAVGLKTSNIRLVTGIFNLCPPINHPVRVAEQIAMIDILTGGRIELGTGRGSGSTEVNTFGVSNEQSRAMWEESIRAIPKMWTQDLFSWEGEHFSVPERCILPKPIQKPHPPLWVTSSNPSTLEVAGRMGLGAAMFNFADPETSRPLVELYKEATEKSEPVGEVANSRIMTISPALCLPDGDEARALYGAGASDVAPNFTVYFDTIPYIADRLKSIPRPIPQTELRKLIAEAASDPSLKGPIASGVNTFDFHLENGICVGSPDEVAAVISRFRDVGFDQLVIVPAPSPGIPHAKSLESIRLIGKEVLPCFRG